MPLFPAILRRGSEESQYRRLGELVDSTLHSPSNSLKKIRPCFQDAEKKQFTDKVNDSKKEIKGLTAKLKFLHNPTKKNQKQVQQDSALQQQKKIPLPKGAKSFDDGVCILDLQIIDLKKQNDSYHAKILEKQEYMDKLTEEYQKLLTYKNEKTSPTVIERPPETMEEDQNRKVGKYGFLRGMTVWVDLNDTIW